MATLDPAINVIGGGFSNILSYALWLLIPVGIVAIGLIIWVFKKVKAKKGQWTHTLKVRRVLDNNRLSDPVLHHMRRFPIIKKAEVFELETPLLGGYLIPELDEYSGLNEFSIILDKNNRIYTNKGEFFNPDKSSVNVSAKHSEIDISRQNLRAKYQDINRISKRIEWATIAKYAFMAVAIVAMTVLGIVAIQSWGDAQKFQAEEAQAMQGAMLQLAEAMETVEATVNTQKLEILPLMREIYNTQNIAQLINQEIELEEDGAV